MKSYSLFVLLVVSMLGWMLQAESRPAAGQDQPQAPPKYVSLRQLPNQITQAVLSNGLTVLVQENHAAPVATVRSYVKNTGSAYEGKYLGAGLSHVLEHVVAGGTTTTRSEKEIEAIIDRFGGATNAYTTTYMTAFYIDCPSRHVADCISLVADSMQNITFEPKEFNRELAVVQRELADGETDRQRVLFKMLDATIYQVHPIRHPTIGYLEVLQGVSNQAIIDFYHDRYVPNNLIFVVVGDVDTNTVLDQVAKEFAGARRKPDTLVVMPQEPEQMSPRSAERAMEGENANVVLAWPTVELSHPDLYPLDVASYILTEGDSSRLARRLKFDEQIVLSVTSSSYTPHFAPGWFAVFMTLKLENIEKAQKIVFEEINRLRDELVDADELAKAKKQKAAELVFDQQTVQQQAESLGRSFISADDPLFDAKYVANIQKVTAEEIRESARRWFVPERLNTVKILPLEQEEKTEQLVEAQKESPIQKHTFDNGLTVLVKRLPTVPLVTIQAYMLGGVLAETDETAGLSSLTAAMLDKGTTDYSAEQIAEYFDSVGGSLASTAGRNTNYVTATVLKEDAANAAEVFSQCVLHPTFPEDEYAKVQNLALGAIAQRQASPQAEAFEFFYENLPESSAYHLPQGGKAETVSKLTVDDVRRFHQKYYVPNNMVVSVFGDIDPEQALALVEKHFGHLHRSPDFQPPTYSKLTPLQQDVFRHKQTRKQAGMVLMGYPAVSLLDKRDYAALTVLDAIMSGYSYPGGWLHNELRGEGLVYYVHAFLLTGPAPGYFTVLSQTSPDRVDEVVSRIQANVERARDGKISEEEFERAKEMVVSLHAMENTTATAQAQQSSLDELYGLGYDYSDGFDDRIEAVTLEEVIGVARRYLTHALIATTSPEPSEVGGE